jgi:hypothetical protein
MYSFISTCINIRCSLSREGRGMKCLCGFISMLSLVALSNNQCQTNKNTTGNMHDYIKGSRLAGGSTLPPIDLLRIAM